MSKTSDRRRTSIFKFASSGLSAAILETADYIRSERSHGRFPVEPTYEQAANGDHYFHFTFPKKEV